MKSSLRLPQLLRQVGIRFLIAYPVCFYCYGAALISASCLKALSEACIPEIFFSPFFLIMGPLAHEEENPPNIYLSVLIITSLTVALWTLAHHLRDRRRTTAHGD